MQHSTQPAVEISASMSFTALKQALAAAGVPEQLLFHASDRAGLIAIAEARGLLSAHTPDSSALPPSSTSVASIVASHRLSRANERASPRLQSSTLVARKDQEIAQKDQAIAQKDQEIEELRSKVEMLRRATPADVGSEPSQAPAGTAKSGAASASAASAANAAMTSSARSESANAVATEQDTGTSSRSWDIDAWIQSLGVHELISACVMPPKGTDHFAYAKGLTAKVVASKLSDCRLVETLAGAIARGAVALLEQKAATAVALSDKFAGEAFKGELRYASLSTFYEGLSGLIGDPLMVEGSLLKGMEAEHNERPDSKTVFVRSMNKKEATPMQEWEIVLTPVEGTKYSSGRTIGDDNSALPLEVILERMRAKNLELRAKGHTELVKEEVVGARLYTGPMFEKYNFVLRFFTGKTRYTNEELGRKGESGLPFLLRQCAAFHLGTWCDDGTGALEWQWHNKYPTTIHAINSCVLVASKLSKAGSVYRGLTDAILPQSFFVKDEDGTLTQALSLLATTLILALALALTLDLALTFPGLSGGIEYGFTSTTPDRGVAMGYAQGKASTVFEARMGMTDRGAIISWLSQFAHEQEVLYPPLTALEVTDTRVEGGTLVVASKLSLNMASLTLAQLVSRRRTIVSNMSEQMQIQARFKLEESGGDWSEVRALKGGEEAVARFLDSFMNVATREPEHYNVDAQLGSAVLDAVALSNILGAWPAGLKALREREKKESVADLVPGEDCVFRLCDKKDVTEQEVAHGIIALSWIEGLTAIDLREQKLSPEIVVAIARAMPPSLTSLLLTSCDIANDGKDLKGVEQLCLALKANSALTSIDFA